MDELMSRHTNGIRIESVVCMTSQSPNESKVPTSQAVKSCSGLGQVVLCLCVRMGAVGLF